LYSTIQSEDSEAIDDGTSQLSSQMGSGRGGKMKFKQSFVLATLQQQLHNPSFSNFIAVYQRYKRQTTHYDIAKLCNIVTFH